MHPFELLAIDHVVLRCRDPEGTAAFYRDVLGCALERRNRPLGLIHLRAGSALIDLIGVDGELGRAGGAAPGAQGRNVDHVCLRIRPFDAQALTAHLAAHGVTVRGEVRERYGAEGNGPSLYLSDPEGNVVELKGPAAA